MKFDLELFEQLNDEYRDRPIIDVAKTQERRNLLSPKRRATSEGESVTPGDRAQYAAQKQLTPILRDIEMSGKAVLELGCGHGWLTSILPDQAGATRAVGVDITPYSSWSEHTDPRVEMCQVDLSRERTFPPESFDTVVSVVTFEHVARPLQMLTALHELLKEGGEAWLRMNVYTSRSASHKYSEVFFPWPHLLFDNEVCSQFYLKHHGKSGQRFSWVNNMTVAHYLHAAREAGFGIKTVRRTTAPIDIPFYLRFIDTLGRYPALDLETDFLTLVLTKGDQATDDASDEVSGSLDLAYTDRQFQLDGRILRFTEGDEIEPAAEQLPASEAPEPEAADTQSDATGDADPDATVAEPESLTTKTTGPPESPA